MLLLISILIITTLIYYLCFKHNKYWSNKGIKQGKPLPFVGDSWWSIAQTKSWAKFIEETYNATKNLPFYGIYHFTTPILIVNDPELIRQITVKDFDHFLDHMEIIPETGDPLWNKNLSALKGSKWREMRSTLSPVFTSSKIKFMFELMRKNAQQLSAYFLEQQEQNSIEFRDMCRRFANDVIASSAFGVECDSLRERNNEFFLMGEDATDFNDPLTMLKVTAFFLIPKIGKILQLNLFSRAVREFFTGLVSHNIREREINNIVRPDLIHILMEARKHGFKSDAKVDKILKNISDLDIAAQALIFFFAGYDTVSTLMSWMGYELGVNRDIQERLRAEIDQVYEASNHGQVSYDTLQSMKYMDMVVSESLRKWPAAIATDRVCTKNYTLKDTNGEQIELNVGTILWLPIYGIHRDERYYPDPERFDPERFSDENKDKIKPYTYFPFGVGPRACIGSRFALLEIKVLFFYILRHFEIVPNAKSEIPAQINKKGFNLHSENGLWFDLKKRSDNK